MIGGVKASADVGANRVRGAASVQRLGPVFPVLGLLMLLMAACGPTTTTASLASDQTFVWPLQQEATVNDEVLDPAEILTSYDLASAQLIYSGLVTLGSDLTVQNDSAKKIEVDTTGTKYTFHLLTGLHFSDGQPLRAADFAYGIDRALDPHLCDGADSNGNAIAYGNSPYGGNCNYGAATYLNHILGATDRINGNGGSDHSVVAQGDHADKGVSILDDQTLVIRLDAPIAYFLDTLTYPTSYPLEQALVDKYPGGQWVNHLTEGGCSGPFKLESYGDSKTLTFVPNSSWETAHNQRLTLTKIVRPYALNVDQEYNDYRAGKYDYTDVPGRSYAYARGQDDFHEVASLKIQYFGLNFLTPPFDSLDVRRAFDLALNKQLLVDRIYDGGGIPTNHVVPQNMPGYFAGLVNPPTDRTQSLTGNQSAAAGLLKVAQQQCKGPPKPFQRNTDPDWCPYTGTGTRDSTDYSPLKEIDVWVATTNQTRVDVTTAAVTQWATVLGLNIQLKTAPSFGGALLPHIRTGAYGAWAIGWLADYPDPQDWLSLQFATGSVANYSHVSNSDLDALMSKADVDQNPATRLQEYNTAEQQVVDLVPWIPYAQEKVTWRLRSWVHGFGLNTAGTVPDIQWPSIYITSH